MMGHIFLYGPPGSGKTTLGRLLADSLCLPFVDLDRAIEAGAGMPVAQIMRDRGEEAFRTMESAALREQLEGSERVIALGGGALLSDGNRSAAEARGRILCLRAEMPVLRGRLQTDGHARPLLEGDLDSKLARLLAARAEHYASFAMQVDSSRPPESVVRHLQAAAGRFRIEAMHGCDVLLEPGGLSRLGELLRDRAVARAAVITDENVAALYSGQVLGSLTRAGLDAPLLVISPGEASKSLETVSRLWSGLLEANLDRSSTVIALGGGVVGDVAGFAASTFMRGIDWVYVPTTVLAMVDASIGGKTGIDLPEGKNLAGSFHAPRLVLADPGVLGTLPAAELRAGLAEALKHGVIGDPQLFELCAGGLDRVQASLPEVLRRAAAVKIGIVERDPFEAGERAALNFGHTVGHAIELVSGFGIRHGEAVAIGMAAEARLAERLGIAARGLSDSISGALAALGLPVSIPAELPRPALIAALRVDKKRAGGVVRFSLPRGIGSMELNVPVREPAWAFEEG